MPTVNKLLREIRTPDIYQEACPICAAMASEHDRILALLRKAQAQFRAEHPQCASCGILMGEGHIEAWIDATCPTCSRGGQR